LKARAAPATRRTSITWCRARRRRSCYWEPSNLVAACRRFNYGDGSRVAADNRRQQIAYLQQLVEEQQQQIAQMAERLARYDNDPSPSPEPALNRPVPRIF
jgi:hypothetical protein